MQGVFNVRIKCRTVDSELMDPFGRGLGAWNRKMLRNRHDARPETRPRVAVRIRSAYSDVPL